MAGNKANKYCVLSLGQVVCPVSKGCASQASMKTDERITYQLAVSATPCNAKRMLTHINDVATLHMSRDVLPHGSLQMDALAVLHVYVCLHDQHV